MIRVLHTYEYSDQIVVYSNKTVSHQIKIAMQLTNSK
jgi:hypothetical protein